jgi:copper homeostasis protein
VCLDHRIRLYKFDLTSKPATFFELHFSISHPHLAHASFGLYNKHGPMQNHFSLEIAVDTIEAAAAAQRAGADRVELCEELTVGGLTPDLALLRGVKRLLQIPIFVMIRPRVGDFVYSASEFEDMQDSISAAKNVGAHGIVLGILTPDHGVDIKRTSDLVALAKPLPATFHRAFDHADVLPQALEDIVQSGATRILTSGAAATALEGSRTIAQLILAAGQRVKIVPGAGINPENILQVAAATRASEFHSGLSSALPYPRTDYSAFEEAIRKLVAGLDSLARSSTQDSQ